MLTINGDAFLVVLPELLQLLLGVLRLIDAQDDGESIVATVERADPALQAVVQLGISLVGVLLALERLMIRGAVGVGRKLPAVGTQIVVVLLADSFYAWYIFRACSCDVQCYFE